MWGGLISVGDQNGMCFCEFPLWEAKIAVITYKYIFHQMWNVSWNDKQLSFKNTKNAAVKARTYSQIGTW